MSKKIPLTQGKFAIVDDADYKWLSQWKWCVLKSYHTWYAVRNSLCKNGKRTMIRMHREILNLKYSDPRQCDHRDGNGLNNQRSNLRIATNAQNLRNQKPQKGGTSQFKGVYWHQQKAKWMTRVRVNGQAIYLGQFDSEIKAAKTYDKAAKMFFGKFAHTNF